MGDLCLNKHMQIAIFIFQSMGYRLHAPVESLHIIPQCVFLIGSRRIVVPCIPVQHLTSVSLEISHTEHFWSITCSIVSFPDL